MLDNYHHTDNQSSYSLVQTAHISLLPNGNSAATGVARDIYAGTLGKWSS